MPNGSRAPTTFFDTNHQPILTPCPSPPDIPSTEIPQWLWKYKQNMANSLSKVDTIFRYDHVIQGRKEGSVSAVYAFEGILAARTPDLLRVSTQVRMSLPEIPEIPNIFSTPHTSARAGNVKLTRHMCPSTGLAGSASLFLWRPLQDWQTYV